MPQPNWTSRRCKVQKVEHVALKCPELGGWEVAFVSTPDLRFQIGEPLMEVHMAFVLGLACILTPIHLVASSPTPGIGSAK